LLVGPTEGFETKANLKVCGPLCIGPRTRPGKGKVKGPRKRGPGPRTQSVEISRKGVAAHQGWECGGGPGRSLRGDQKVPQGGTVKEIQKRKKMTEVCRLGSGDRSQRWSVSHVEGPREICLGGRRSFKGSLNVTHGPGN